MMRVPNVSSTLALAIGSELTPIPGSCLPGGIAAGDLSKISDRGEHVFPSFF